MSKTIRSEESPEYRTDETAHKSSTRQLAAFYREECSDVPGKTKGEILGLARALMRECVSNRGVTFDCPKVASDLFQLQIGAKRNEVFVVAYLDTRHRLIELIEEFQGTIDGASVHPRVIVQHALELDAAAVLLSHNHPSGITEPSAADERITRRIKDALALVDVRTLDHIVVSESGYTSMAERGQI